MYIILYRLYLLNVLNSFLRRFYNFIKQVTLLIIIFKIHFYDDDLIKLIKILNFQQVIKFSKNG